MTLNVKTNGHRRELHPLDELPTDQQELFDYVDLDDHSYRFVYAYGAWYDVFESEKITVEPEFHPFGFNVKADSPLVTWHSVVPEPYWIGVAFRFLGPHFGGLREDEGFVVVGQLYSED